MKEQNYDVLEDQIDESAEQLVGPSPKSLGKVRKEVIGAPGELDSVEKSRLSEFASRSTKLIESAQQLAHPSTKLPISDGWIPINREEMGTRSLFYPEDWVFYVKPATVQTIKNWTAVDEERPEVVLQVLNEIVRSSVKIESNLGSVSWKEINTWDQFWFILKVREVTFSKGESKVEFEDECSNCGNLITYTLGPSTLLFDLPDEELIQNYWRGNCWEIDPREYEVDHEPIRLYNPKLGANEIIIQWAQIQGRQNKKIDEQFLNYLLWCFPRPPKDVQMLDLQVKKIKKEYDSWDLDMFNLMKDILVNLPVNPSENLRETCEHCGGEAISQVRFPSGLKALFNTGGGKKFGSRS